MLIWYVGTLRRSFDEPLSDSSGGRLAGVVLINNVRANSRVQQGFGSHTIAVSSWPS
jgi:hypothetical protein